LAKYQRKIGPDSASINSCKIGGIAANNASGMCCGTAQNSCQTLSSMSIILADGTLLDTGNVQSVNQFKNSHSELLNQLENMAADVRQDQQLYQQIKHKYRLKNTTGYGLNALADRTN
jgi:D-lactate dehydrogenase